MSAISRPIRTNALGLPIVFVFIAILGNNQILAQQGKKSRKVETPDPERVLLDTKDNVELRAEWFAGTNGKQSVPLILIHDWDSDRRSLMPLAKQLQEKHGHAVIVPDLRGHGESLTVKGRDEELKRSRFKKDELASMTEDIDTCRRFLQEKNNVGELNLDLLAVVACGKMSAHAVSWCISDWQWAPVAGVKQGQNVKALMLVSPRRRFKSLSMAQGLKVPLFSSKNSALPILLFWGKKHESSAKDGNAIFKALTKSRNDPTEFSGQDDRWAKQTVFKDSYNSSLESDKLLNEQATNLFKSVSIFIEKKIVDRQEDYVWQSREFK